MSLFKAYNNEKSVRTLGYIKKDFMNVFDAVADNFDNAQASDVVALVSFYAEYGASYMTAIATSLEEPRGASDTMKFMNSIIAEVVNKAELHYFDLHRGYSIVDKAVQAALDNGGAPKTEDVVAIINEIEASYEEETEEE